MRLSPFNTLFFFHFSLFHHLASPVPQVAFQSILRARWSTTKVCYKGDGGNQGTNNTRLRGEQKTMIYHDQKSICDNKNTHRQSFFFVRGSSSALAAIVVKVWFFFPCSHREYAIKRCKCSSSFKLDVTRVCGTDGGGVATRKAGWVEDWRTWIFSCFRHQLAW